MKKTIITLSILLLATFSIISSCTEDDVDIILAVLEDIITLDNGDQVGLGLIEDAALAAETPEDIYLGNASATLPAVADMSRYFPPIKSQGSYGTCTAWAVGYYVKTALEAIDQSYTTSQLALTENQFSPKDLFLSIDDRGSNCNGSAMEYAFDVLLNRGIAPLSEVPYEDLGKCSLSSSQYSDIAKDYKIESYRKIFQRDPSNVWTGHHSEEINLLKSYLAQNRPIGICAKLGEKFMACNNSTVLSSDTRDYKGQHSYHAMSLCGYDDSRNAFRVVNSWGDTWGDHGFIWVDYDFFINQFCYLAYVAKNAPARYNPYEEELNEGADLISWNLEDTNKDNARTRQITYDVYNLGDAPIYATQDWSILYIYYNAYDANDYGILIYDYYTNDYGDNDRHYDPIGDGSGYGLSENWWNNIDVPSGTSVAQALVGEENFSFSYEIPADLNGKYYFALIADGYNVIEEYNEANNYLYFSAGDNKPLNIQNGVILNEPLAKKSATLTNNKSKTMYKGMDSPYQTVRTATNRNTYTTTEIGQMLQHHKASGQLDLKVKEYMVSKAKNAIINTGTKTKKDK